MDKKKIEAGVRLILEGIGEDTDREGLRETPERVARMYEEILDGMGKDAGEHLRKTFAEADSEMVLEKNIAFYSTCEHHLMPFYGQVHIAYVPDGRVVGLSKLARTVEVYAARLQLQERMTEQIAEAVMRYLAPKGVMVMVEAEHMCMSMRGVKKAGSKTVTLAKKGAFAQKPELREEFFRLLRG